MTTNKPSKMARRGIWRRRGRRFATGLNVLISLLLLAAAVVMINYLSGNYYKRWNLTSRSYYHLSDKTVRLLASLKSPVDVVAFFQRNDKLYEDVRNLLKEYEYEASGSGPGGLNIEIVDPDRDLARTRELAREYGVEKPNVVVFHCAGRTKYVERKDLADYHYALNEGRSVSKKKVGFRGEQAFSSAIQSVAEEAKPVVYFLSGHGERSVSDFGELYGYSSLARAMGRDNIEVKTLLLAEQKGVPGDCSAIVIAGADRSLSRAEVDLLEDYLDRSGRLLVLLEPVVETGMEELLSKWGVKVARDVVVGLTLTGRDLVVKDYGKHDITRNLKGITAMFYLPRSVELLDPVEKVSELPADRPHVFVLASTTPEGWAEYDLSESPARFDPEVDRRGPVSVAVAVEKGPVPGIDVEIRPTRIVVVGDSDFVSNNALASGVGGNLDFFLSSLNWLVEREALLAISPKVPGELRFEMSRKQWRLAFASIVIGVPLFVAFIGFLVRLARKH